MLYNKNFKEMYFRLVHEIQLKIVTQVLVGLPVDYVPYNAFLASGTKLPCKALRIWLKIVQIILKKGNLINTGNS